MTHGDPYEELAALFLTPADHDAPASGTPARSSSSVVGRPRRAQPTLELVLVGHLPVRAALWLAPFAGAVSRERGLTALVRLDSEEPLVQVFGGAGDPMRSGSCRNLRETILFLGRTVRTWLLRPSARHDAAAMLALRPSRITVLSGTDEAALVHAYRLIRQLHDAAEAAGQDLPAVDIAVLGSDESAAGDMLVRLNRTAQTWAKSPITCRLVLPRIDASVRSSGLRSFADQTPPDLADVATWIDLGRAQFHQDDDGTALRSDASHMAAAHDDLLRPTTVRTAGGGTPLRVADDESADADIDDPIFRDPPVSRTPEVFPNSPLEATSFEQPIHRAASSDMAGAFDEFAAPPRGRHGRPEPLEDVREVRAVAFVEARAPADPVEEDERGMPISFSRRVPGLTALAVRMPGHEHAELAVDAAGRVHVLMRDDRLREAATIQAWVRSHREIIALACREHAINAAGRSDVHLFTDQPLRVADLHGGAYHLHLLARVPAGDGHAFVSMPLGRPAAV